MRSKSIRKTRVNKKKNNRKKTMKKCEMIAKVIPIPYSNDTIIMFNKHVPKNVINKVLNKINSSGRKRTRKNKRNKIYRGGVHESAMAMKLGEGLAAAAQSPGPLGMMYRFGSKVYGYGGGMMGTLVIGATLATILGSLKTMNIMTPDSEIDLVKQKNDDRVSCKGGIIGANGQCLPKIVGTTPSRRIKRKAREDAVEAQRKREQTMAEGAVEAQRKREQTMAEGATRHWI